MDDFVQWLGAQLDEDERIARLMEQHYPSPWELSDRGRMARVVAEGPVCREVVRLEQWQVELDDIWLGDVIEHVARHDPARVLREIDAKRQILRALHSAEIALRNTEPGKEPHELMTGAANSLRAVVRMHATAYSDRPGYRKEWRP